MGWNKVSKLLILRSLLNTCDHLSYYDEGFHDGSVLTNLPAMQETQEMQVQSLGPEDPLEGEMATHSSILARKIPWTDELGGLQSKGSHRMGHD